jgi:hypothetical protein
VTAAVDSQAASVSASGGISIDVNRLTPGTHSLRVIFSNSGGADTTTTTFRIDPASTPVVKLHADATTVTTATESVTLTVSNVSGEGKSPVFTFARDIGFTDIVEAQGPLTPVTIPVASMAVGKNEFYVRMITSDTCYTVQHAVDSISITVIQQANPNILFDGDNPGVPITTGPNPFSGSLTLRGLMSTKKYSVSLLNGKGQEMARQQVEGQQQTVIYVDLRQTGLYFLRLYDETKGRVIGFMKLLAVAQK